jgi:uncharacterized membrane protein (DUF4010 family)
VLSELIVPLIAAGVAALIYAGIFTLRSVRDSTEREPPAGRPFDPKTALIFVAVVGITLLISAALTHFLGERGLLLASAISGFPDAHAAAISAATLAASERASTQFAALAVLIGFSTNTISKSVVAFTMGTRQYALELLPGLLLIAGSAWGGWAWVIWGSY